MQRIIATVAQGEGIRTIFWPLKRATAPARPWPCAAQPSARWQVLVRIRRALAGLLQGVHSRPRCGKIAVEFPSSTVSEPPFVYVQRSQEVMLFPVIEACKLVALQTPFTFMQHR